MTNFEDYYRAEIARINGCSIESITVTEICSFRNTLSVNYEQLLANSKIRHMSKVFYNQRLTLAGRSVE